MRIAALSFGRGPWSLDSKPVALPRADPPQVGMPAEGGHLTQADALFLPLFVEQTQLDARRHFREDGEIRAASVPDCAQWQRLAGPDGPFGWRRGMRPYVFSSGLHKQWDRLQGRCR